MLKALYEAIRGDAAPVITHIDGRPYSDMPLTPVAMPEVATLRVSTLTGIVEYLKANQDGLEMDDILCHVASPTEAVIISKLQGEFPIRQVYVQAMAPVLNLPFNAWIDSEPFIISAQACFVDDGDRETILKYLSAVVAISESTTSDNGATQGVTVKTGIASKAVKALPNPVTLRPYRTFIEVEQPASKFVFRAKQDGGRMQYLLAEADGNAWCAEAMHNIKAYMEAMVPGMTVIA